MKRGHAQERESQDNDEPVAHNDAAGEADVSEGDAHQNQGYIDSIHAYPRKKVEFTRPGRP